MASVPKPYPEIVFSVMQCISSMNISKVTSPKSAPAKYSG